MRAGCSTVSFLSTSNIFSFLFPSDGLYEV